MLAMVDDCKAIGDQQRAREEEEKRIADAMDTERRRKCTEAFPKGSQYDVLLIDPPWSYQRSKSKLFKGAANYAMMSSAEMMSLPVETLAKKNCALLMWCTGPHIPTAIPLFRQWGFTYKTVFLVWRKIYKSGKPVTGPGWYTRPCHEYLLIGVRGSVIPMRQSRKLSQLLEAEEEVLVVTVPQGHSVKPFAAFNVIEEFFGEKTKKIELFARQPRVGWDTWGMDNDPHFHAGSGTGLVCGDVARATRKRTAAVMDQITADEATPGPLMVSHPSAPPLSPCQVSKPKVPTASSSSSSSSSKLTKTRGPGLFLAMPAQQTMEETLKYLTSHMPAEDDCVWSWTTTHGLFMRRLFDAVVHLVPEGRLIVTAEGIELVPQRTKDNALEVGFKLDTSLLVKYGSFSMTQKTLMIPLNIDEWAHATRAIRADDLVGVCVTKDSIRKTRPTIDLYVAKANSNGNWYQYQCEWLTEEYMHFGLPTIPFALSTMGGASCIMMNGVELKSMLTNFKSKNVQISATPPWLEFSNTTDDRLRGTTMKFKVHTIETLLSTQPNDAMQVDGGVDAFLDDIDQALERMEAAEGKSQLPVLSPPTDVGTGVPTDGAQPQADGTFSVTNILRTTKAVKMADQVTVTFKLGKPLLVEYNTSWGWVQYLVYC